MFLSHDAKGFAKRLGPGDGCDVGWVGKLSPSDSLARCNGATVQRQILWKHLEASGSLKSKLEVKISKDESRFESR